MVPEMINFIVKAKTPRAGIFACDLAWHGMAWHAWCQGHPDQNACWVRALPAMRFPSQFGTSPGQFLRPCPITCRRGDCLSRQGHFWFHSSGSFLHSLLAFRDCFLDSFLPWQVPRRRSTANHTNLVLARLSQWRPTTHTMKYITR